ncbi:PSPA7_2676 family Cys-rich small protein [Pseudomonas donghuensis]|uniref:PSPA7_2676 family Cys-rich small protein n=1 Tax=Pseudomonas donghuensis TaxID=1163398 RepID=UPI003B82FADE
MPAPIASLTKALLLSAWVLALSTTHRHRTRRMGRIKGFISGISRGVNSMQLLVLRKAPGVRVQPDCCLRTTGATVYAAGQPVIELHQRQRVRRHRWQSAVLTAIAANLRRLAQSQQVRGGPNAPWEGPMTIICLFKGCHWCDEPEGEGALLCQRCERCGAVRWHATC